MPKRLTRVLVHFLAVPVVIDSCIVLATLGSDTPDQFREQTGVLAAGTSVGSACLWFLAADFDEDKATNACAALFSAATGMFVISNGTELLSEFWSGFYVTFGALFTAFAVVRIWRRLPL